MGLHNMTTRARRAIKWGDAQAGPLHKTFDGPRPGAAYSPMKKPGGLVLGLGGDTSPGGIGTFYEGVLTRGYSTDAADDAVQVCTQICSTTLDIMRTLCIHSLSCTAFENDMQI